MPLAALAQVPAPIADDFRAAWRSQSPKRSHVERYPQRVEIVAQLLFVNEFPPLDAVPAVTAAPTAPGGRAAAPRRVRLKTAPRQDCKATRIPLEVCVRRSATVARGRALRLRMPQAHVISDPAIMMGKPVIGGTRVTVEVILEKLAAGESIEQVVASHPQLTAEAVRAALEFAAKALRADVVYPLNSETGDVSGG